VKFYFSSTLYCPFLDKTLGEYSLLSRLHLTEGHHNIMMIPTHIKLGTFDSSPMNTNFLRAINQMIHFCSYFQSRAAPLNLCYSRMITRLLCSSIVYPQPAAAYACLGPKEEWRAAQPEYTSLWIERGRPHETLLVGFMIFASLSELFVHPWAPRCHRELQL
jgi:hypothetical protein